MQHLFLNLIIGEQLEGSISEYNVNYREILLTPLTVCVENMSSRQPTSLMSTGSLSSLSVPAALSLSPPPLRPARCVRFVSPYTDLTATGSSGRRQDRRCEQICLIT